MVMVVFLESVVRQRIDDISACRRHNGTILTVMDGVKERKDCAIIANINDISTYCTE